MPRSAHNAPWRCYCWELRLPITHTLADHGLRPGGGTPPTTTNKKKENRPS